MQPSLNDAATLAPDDEINITGASFGDRLADTVARFGGSWSFIISFFALLSVWMAYNVWTFYYFRPDTFDPYPFILLNLVLSCIAAIQAPIIMMSQNRQEARDRERSRHIERMTQHIEVLTENMAAVLQRIEMVEASILSSLNSLTIE